MASQNLIDTPMHIDDHVMVDALQPLQASARQGQTPQESAELRVQEVDLIDFSPTLPTQRPIQEVPPLIDFSESPKRLIFPPAEPKADRVSRNLNAREHAPEHLDRGSYPNYWRPRHDSVFSIEREMADMDIRREGGRREYRGGRGGRGHFNPGRKRGREGEYIFSARRCNFKRSPANCSM